MEGLSKLEYRGYDSAGIAVYNDGKISVENAWAGWMPCARKSWATNR